MNERPTIRQREVTRSRRPIFSSTLSAGVRTVRQGQITRNRRPITEPSTPGNANNVAIGITVGMLGIMGVAIAIDASSMPLLALLTVLSVGGVIAALIAWG